jgi:hypothetical protein
MDTIELQPDRTGKIPQEFLGRMYSLHKADGQRQKNRKYSGILKVQIPENVL